MRLRSKRGDPEPPIGAVGGFSAITGPGAHTRWIWRGNRLGVGLSDRPARILPLITARLVAIAGSMTGR